MTTSVMSSSDVHVGWDLCGRKRCLLFTFPEQLEAASASEAIQAWRDEFAQRTGEKVTLVWDCRVMKGYDSQARREWQAAMQDLKSQIKEIWLVSGSSFVRMGAGLMGRAISINIRTANSMSEVGA